MSTKVNREEIRDFLDSNLMMDRIHKLIQKESDKIRD